MQTVENQLSLRSLLPASCWFLSLSILRPWRWRRHVPPKLWLNFNRLHSVISQRIEFFNINCPWFAATGSLLCCHKKLTCSEIWILVSECVNSTEIYRRVAVQYFDNIMSVKKSHKWVGLFKGSRRIFVVDARVQLPSIETCWSNETYTNAST
jgi:hypothetical protein